MSHYPPPATKDEWIRAIQLGFATYDMAPGHHMAVSIPGQIQVRCTCGWTGPDRTHEPSKAAELAITDVDWHMEWVAESARIQAATLALGLSQGWDR